MNEPKGCLRLSKLDVARRQLDAALDLWFKDYDPVPVHTLACAAHEILAGICKKRKLPELMFDPSLYLPGKSGLARKTLHTHYNFFKHANTDPEGVVDFKNELTEGFLLMAIEGWRDLGGDRRELDEAFKVHFLMRRPEIHRADTPELVRHLLGIKELARLMPDSDRRKFLVVFRIAFAQWKKTRGA